MGSIEAGPIILFKNDRVDSERLSSLPTVTQHYWWGWELGPAASVVILSPFFLWRCLFGPVQEEWELKGLQKEADNDLSEWSRPMISWWSARVCGKLWTQGGQIFWTIKKSPEIRILMYKYYCFDMPVTSSKLIKHFELSKNYGQAAFTPWPWLYHFWYVNHC